MRRQCRWNPGSSPLSLLAACGLEPQVLKAPRLPWRDSEGSCDAPVWPGLPPLVPQRLYLQREVRGWISSRPPWWPARPASRLLLRRSNPTLRPSVHAFAGELRTRAAPPTLSERRRPPGLQSSRATQAQNRLLEFRRLPARWIPQTVHGFASETRTRAAPPTLSERRRRPELWQVRRTLQARERSQAFRRFPARSISNSEGQTDARPPTFPSLFPTRDSYRSRRVLPPEQKVPRRLARSISRSTCRPDSSPLRLFSSVLRISGRRTARRIPRSTWRLDYLRRLRASPER